MSQQFKRSAKSLTGGNPAGLPDFRPINKLPRAEVNEILARQVRPILYQVHVEERSTGNDIPIGPKCPQSAAHALAEAINVQVLLGKEKTWTNAYTTAVVV